MPRRRTLRQIAALFGVLPLAFAPTALAQEIEPPAPAEAEPPAPPEGEPPAEADENAPAEEAEVTDTAEAVAPEPPAEVEPEAAEEVALADPRQVPVVEAEPRAHGFEPRFVLDTGRTPIRKGTPGEMTAQVHGEYQLRLSAMSDLPLMPTTSDPAASLGQTWQLYQWLRITPRFQIGESFDVVGQIDIPRGMIAGETTHAVHPAEEPFDERSGFQVAPRWLYLEKRASYGLWRIGQQGSYWGMGLVANDGDHPSLFGDYRGGDIVERILFATRPLGKDSPFIVALAGDLVFRDEQAKLADGDRAFQGVLSMAYDDGDNLLGVYGVYRHQTRDREAISELTPFDEKLKVVVLDIAGKFSTEIPGTRAYAFGQFEAAAIMGTTSVLRTTDQTRHGEVEKVRSYGGAARLGAVQVSGQGEDRYGSFVASLEWGYASGDANSNDGTTRRFTFDPNHKVGLLLFDHVLAWKTARAAAAAGDPGLVARAMPGTQLLPSNGGIFGATYLYPTFVYRPHRALDTKLGVVIAQSTSDLVDPYHLNALGKARNYDGGDAKRHDLGLELDAGFEWRLAMGYGLTLQLGAEGGLLFPGHAFDDANGAKMQNQWIGVGRAGLQY